MHGFGTIGYTPTMWILIAVIAVALALVVWRFILIAKNRSPSRPVDSGHPHMTDVDPHPGGSAE